MSQLDDYGCDAPPPAFLSGFRARVGESAAWDEARGRILSVDMWGKTVWSVDPATGAGEAFATEEMAAAVLPCRSGRVIALESHLLVQRPDGSLRRIEAPSDHPSSHRFNDACIDPAGRLVIGTMRKSHLGAEPTGKLYRLEDESWRLLAEGFRTVNGLAFSPDGKWLFVSDSHPAVQTVWRHPHDPATGALGAAEAVIDFAALCGRPDGAAFDRDNLYWIAGVGGGVVHAFTIAGDHVRTVGVPVENPTKVAFGGEGLRTLFVTSMAERLTRPDGEGLAGALIGFDVGVGGAPLPELVC